MTPINGLGGPYVGFSNEGRHPLSGVGWPICAKIAGEKERYRDVNGKHQHQPKSQLADRENSDRDRDYRQKPQAWDRQHLP